MTTAEAKEIGALKNQVENIASDINDIKKAQTAQVKAFDDFKETLIEKFDERYADKRTEKIVYYGCGFILLAFLATVVYLIGWQSNSTNVEVTSTQPQSSAPGSTSGGERTTVVTVPASGNNGSTSNSSTPQPTPQPSTTPSPSFVKSVLGL